MSLILYATAVAVWALLIRQNRRHTREIAFELERAGFEISSEEREEKLLRIARSNLALGIVLAIPGIALLRVCAQMAQKANDAAKIAENDISTVSLFLLGGALALIFLGTRALLELRQLRRI